jgi:hypothetical protein
MSKCLTALAGLISLIAAVIAVPALAETPAQRVPSAIIVYPYVTAESGYDTRIEIVNLSSREQHVKCIYIRPPGCFGVNFFIRLTPNQPLSWLASQGNLGPGVSAVPGFFGSGELKCIVTPADEPSQDHQNAIQGRAIVFGPNGETESFGAIGFQRLTPGPQERVLELDGVTYAQCPDEYHFAFVSSEAGDPATESDIVFALCDEDLENVRPSTTVIQFRVINEFEQLLSASTSVTCHARRGLAEISSVFSRDTLGTETGHMIVRGVQSAVMAVMIDRFVTPGGTAAVTSNEPFLLGGRSATIELP